MPYVLPYQYRFLHQYCILVHDQIVGLLRGGSEAEIFTVILPGHDVPPDISGEPLYRWIEQNVGAFAAREMDFKAIVKSLSVDFCHYVLEALNAAKKGKMTVAYSLIRKPVQDNLAYLEWLLADPHDFFARFHGENLRDIEFKALSVDRRKEIITVAATLAGERSSLLVDFLYSTRYEKSSASGLAQAADQALHLITTNKYSPTMRSNFNFVFSGEQQIDSQWANFYHILPHILYHASYVIERLIDQIAVVRPAERRLTRFRRDLGQSLVHVRLNPGSGIREMQPWIARILMVDFRCVSCGDTIQFHVRNLTSLVIRGGLRCRMCKTVSPLYFLPRLLAMGLGRRISISYRGVSVPRTSFLVGPGIAVRRRVRNHSS